MSFIKKRLVAMVSLTGAGVAIALASSVIERKREAELNRRSAASRARVPARRSPEADAVQQKEGGV